MKTLVIKPNYSETAAGALCLSYTTLLDSTSARSMLSLSAQGEYPRWSPEPAGPQDAVCRTDPVTLGPGLMSSVRQVGHQKRLLRTSGLTLQAMIVCKGLTLITMADLAKPRESEIISGATRKSHIQCHRQCWCLFSSPSWTSVCGPSVSRTGG